MVKKRVVSRKKVIRFILISIIILIVIGVISFISLYQNNIKAVSDNKQVVSFTVEKDSSLLSISHSLKEKKLIRSELFYKLYIKLNKKSDIKQGTYSLSSSMNVETIVNILGGDDYQSNNLVTFQEGINMRKIVSIISSNTKNTPEQIYAKLKDEDFLNRMIDKYWFLTDTIKNKKIYYSLEGYLFPDTYNIKAEDSIENIFIMMLNNTEKKFNSIKSLIQSQPYNVHNMLTFASIVEAESPSKNDRKKVAGVFFNRLQNHISLGSDVTTYYSVKIDVNERDLYQSEINDCNDYNTRCTTMKGLPVGPINNPGMESIMATLQPNNHDYFYFVADKNGKTYYAKTYQGHLKIVDHLKEQGLWFTY